MFYQVNKCKKKQNVHQLELQNNNTLLISISLMCGTLAIEYTIFMSEYYAMQSIARVPVSFE